MKMLHCADSDRLATIPSDIVRDELTRSLRLLQHARHVPAVGALVAVKPGSPATGAIELGLVSGVLRESRYGDNPSRQARLRDAIGHDERN
jgi:hypothetical protein